MIESYDGAPAVDEALRIMAAAYRKLEMNDLATVADNVRKTNVLPDETKQENLPATNPGGASGTGHARVTAPALRHVGANT